MQMTEEEIVRRYKQADNKRDSIRILAELNAKIAELEVE